jgi:hypothetical protein
MPPVLPFDIINLIIDIVGEKKDTDLLKELALVCHSFLHICSKHLFATIELHDAVSASINYRPSKKGFIKLLKRRPDVVKYIRQLSYKVNSTRGLVCPRLNSRFDHNDHLLSSILLTIPRLNCLKINCSQFHWSSLSSSLRSAFLHLMHLPTLKHVDLSYIHSFPLSYLTPSVNLLRLDISHLSGGSAEFFGQSEMMPKIREFHTSQSTLLTTTLLQAKMQDGRPVFNFMDLRLLSMSFTWGNDVQNYQYLLQNAKLLEKLHLSVGAGRSLVGVLSPSARNLKVLSLSIPLYSIGGLPLGGLCEELEAMAGDNMLEVLSCEVCVYPSHTKDIIGSVIRNVEKVLIKPGWSSLRQISLKLSCRANTEPNHGRMLSEALQSLPDEYLSLLSKLESVAFDYSAYAVYV